MHAEPQGFWKVVLKAYDAAVARDENFGKLFE